jgi:WD40 repeat protein
MIVGHSVALYDARVAVWDAETGQLIDSLPTHGGTVTALQFTADGRQFITGSTDWYVRLWDGQTRKFIRIYKHWAPVIAASINDNGTQICASSIHENGVGEPIGYLRSWDAITGKERGTVPTAGDVYKIQYGADDATIVTINDGKVHIWSADSLTLLRRIPENGKPGDFVLSALDAKHGHAAFGDRDGNVRLLTFENNFVADTSDAVWAIRPVLLSMTDLDFGTLPQFATGTQTLVIRNESKVAVHLEKVTIAGSSGRFFQVYPNIQPQWIAPGGEYSHTIRFHADSAGVHQATITATFDVASISARLTGVVALQPIQRVRDRIRFRYVPMGSYRDTVVTVVRNVDTIPWTITTSLVPHPDSAQFRIGESEGGDEYTLLPGDTITLDIRFMPSIELEEVTEQLQISFNGIGSPVSIDLVGNDRVLSIPNKAEFDDAGISLQCLPIPAHDNVELSYRFPTSGHTRLTLVDAIGRRVMVAVNEFQSVGSHVLMVDVSLLPSGMYFWIIEHEGRRAIRSLQVVQ